MARVKKVVESAGTINRVFLYGCRPPRDAVENARALQLLGQAENYTEDLKRIYNTHKVRVRALLARERFTWADDDAHVTAWRQLDKDHSHVLAWLHREMLDAVNAARKTRGHLVDAGTYWLVEKAMNVAHKTSRLNPIKRDVWDGTGRIGAAIQSTESFPVNDWRHARVQLWMPSAEEKKARSKRSQDHGTLTMIVGAASRKESITWPLKLDRPLPPGAVVKQVAVQRRRDGHRFRWEALITVAYEAEMRDVTAEGIVGIDIGWRSEEVTTERKRHEPSWDRGRERRGMVIRSIRTHDVMQMRVGTYDAEDDDGALIINTYGKYRYVDEVLGTRDQEYNRALADAVARDLGADSRWLRKERLHRLARLTGDAALLTWSQRDKHLEDIAVGVRKKAMRLRLDVMRKHADDLAKRYRYVALEDMPMATWVGRGDTSDLERRRSAAALYLFQLTLAQRFGSLRTDWVPAAYTTMTCACCGVVREESVGPASHWTCACGVTHHQDYNAAEIIRRSSERWLADGNPPRARKRKSLGKRGEEEIVVIEESEDDGTAREALLEAAE